VVPQYVRMFKEVAGLSPWPPQDLSHLSFLEKIRAQQGQQAGQEAEGHE